MPDTRLLVAEGVGLGRCLLIVVAGETVVAFVPIAAEVARQA